MPWLQWNTFCDLRDQHPDGFGQQCDEAISKHTWVPPMPFERASVNETIETGIEVSQDVRAVPYKQVEFLGKKGIAKLPTIDVPLGGGPE
eukprot:5592775-Pyramimonas_sp.AAC.1